MGYPTKPEISYSYTGFSQGQGDNTFPGPQMDNDLAVLESSLGATIDFLKACFNSSGVLATSSMPNSTDLTAYTAQSAASAVAASNSAASAAISASDATTQALNASASAASVAAGNFLAKANNLSDIPAPSTARTNLGLGGLAVLSSVDLAQLTAAVTAALVPTGTVSYFEGAAAPTGWVIANGGTIGNASSGASVRANADTLALFTLYWTAYTDATRPILTSAGGASTRGASAAADFAAGKRITITELRGEFIRGLDSSRGVDTSRVLGSAQAEMIGPHTHGINATFLTNRNTSTGGTERVVYENGGVAGSLGMQNNSGTENRPRNVALLAIIKL